MKVGDPIWSRRTHVRVPYRDSWQKLMIIGETRVSWIVGYAMNDAREVGRPKKKDMAAGLLTTWATSQEEIEEKARRVEWLSANAINIKDMVRVCDDVEKLRQIGAVLGYVAKEPAK